MPKRKTKSKKTYKLNIFELINHFKAADIDYYDRLSEEQKKGFVPRVAMRWLSGTKSALHVNYVNEFLNPVVDQFTLKDFEHKKLLYLLGTICANPQEYRYKFPKMKTNKGYPLAISIIKEFYGYSTKHAKDALPVLDNVDIIACAEDLGKQKEVITKLKRELKNR